MKQMSSIMALNELCAQQGHFLCDDFTAILLDHLDLHRAQLVDFCTSGCFDDRLARIADVSSHFQEQVPKNSVYCGAEPSTCTQKSIDNVNSLHVMKEKAWLKNG